MRLGIFGGTFDPVHLGHLILAEQCREQAALDQVLFVPAARPPHKLDQDITPFDQRAEMLALALSGQPAFQVDAMEKHRQGPSYTVDTLEVLRDHHPDADLLLMIGSDTLADLPTWRQPRRILDLAQLLVVARPDFSVPDPDQVSRALELERPLNIHLVDAPLIAISSRDIRRRVARGGSIRYQVPRAVEAYIRDKHLFQGTG